MNRVSMYIASRSSWHTFRIWTCVNKLVHPDPLTWRVVPQRHVHNAAFLSVWVNKASRTRFPLTFLGHTAFFCKQNELDRHALFDNRGEGREFSWRWRTVGEVPLCVLRLFFKLDRHPKTLTYYNYHSSPAIPQLRRTSRVSFARRWAADDYCSQTNDLYVNSCGVVSN